jgi:hypothetical protein
VSLSTEEVRVPDAEQTADDWDVLLEGSLLEVLVHGMSTSKELMELVVTNVQSNRQANGAPHAVTATNPVRKSEHILWVNAEVRDLLRVGRQSNEVLGNVLLLSRLEEPALCRVGVCDGLGSGEGLGGDEEESGLWVRGLQGLSDVGAINVGDEVQLEVALAIWLEGFGDHDWAAKGA